MQRDIETIKSVIENYFGESIVYIFGSQLDNNRRGGDIDIFVIPKEELENRNSKKAMVRYRLEELLLRPVDIVFHKDFKRTIEQEALKGVKI